MSGFLAEAEKDFEGGESNNSQQSSDGNQQTQDSSNSNSSSGGMMSNLERGGEDTMVNQGEYSRLG